MRKALLALGSITLACVGGTAANAQTQSITEFCAENAQFFDSFSECVEILTLLGSYQIPGDDLTPGFVVECDPFTGCRTHDYPPPGDNGQCAASLESDCRNGF